VDFNLLASNFSATSKVWGDGDFNYDGTVDTVDFNLLAASFSKSTSPADLSPAALGALVPEPASLTIVGGALCGLLGSRRRRQPACATR